MPNSGVETWPCDTRVWNTGLAPYIDMDAYPVPRRPSAGC